MDVRDLERRLTTWSPEELTALLERRGDVLHGRPPGSVAELARRLAQPSSVVGALRGVTLPQLQALDALVALGERASRTALAELLAGDGPGHERDVDAALADLAALALVATDGSGRVDLAPGVTEVVIQPLSLDAPARELWSTRTVGEIDRAVSALGGRRGPRKAESLAALLALLEDAAAVRGRVARADPAVAADLHRRAGVPSVTVVDDDVLDGFYLDDRYDPVASQRQRETERWGLAAGLLVGTSWGGQVRMPAEVALALRGPEWRAPFTPRPPDVPTGPVRPEAVDAAAAAAVAAFSAAALSVLDRLDHEPVPRLAGGGLGVRELGRLGKRLHIDETTLRLVLELAADAGLVSAGPDGVGVTADFAPWRALGPSARLTMLLQTWWRFFGAPTRARTGGDLSGWGTPAKTLPALQPEECGACQAARIALVAAAAELPPGASAERADVAAAARWSRPMVHVLPQDADLPLATHWREAELLGVVAAGALSPLGRVLLDDDAAALTARLRAMLPEERDEAVFGSDLTVLVTGSPTARVSALLDACADRESSGGATTWRIGPGSVRRALDGGAEPAALLQRLRAISIKDLPQPLTYLVTDVARRHGRLRVSATVSLIRSDDGALLAEVAADRRLAALGLRPVAPTVLSCAVAMDTALARLRETGYFPMPEPDDETVVTRTGIEPPGPPLPRAPRPRAAAVATDVGEVVAQLRSSAPAPDLAPPSRDDERWTQLAGAARHLAGEELDLLTDALLDGGRLLIGYADAGGRVTTRVIRDPVLESGLVHAWCELRQDERFFAPARVLFVEPAG